MLLNEFTFLSVKEIKFGPGVVITVGDVCKRLGINKALVVCDPFLVSSQIVNRITDILDEGNIIYSIFSDFMTNPTISQVTLASDFMKVNEYDGVIGFGGGSSIDTAKAIALLMNNPKPINQYFGVNKVPNKACPIITIPTTAGTGSEVSDACILKDDITHIKSGIRSKCIVADVAIVDPEMTSSMPAQLTASTGLDALTHAIEGYVSNLSNIMTQMFDREAIKLIVENLRRAVGNGNDIEARYHVMLGSMYAGWAMATASVGACHAMAYPVESKYNIAHGDVNAALLPAVMRYNVIANMQKYKEIAECMGENVRELSIRDAAYRSVEAVDQLVKDLGIRNLAQIGVKEEDLDSFTETVLNNSRLMKLNPREVTVEACKYIYRDAMGII